MIEENEFLDYLKERALFVMNDIEEDKNIKNTKNYETKIAKSKYFRYLNKFFCYECVLDLEYCSVCNALCINNGQQCQCGHCLVYCNKCSVYCDLCSLPVCNKDDERKNYQQDGMRCHEYHKCMKCKHVSCSGTEKINKGMGGVYNCCGMKNEDVMRKQKKKKLAMI